MNDAKQNLLVILGCILIGILVGGFSVYFAMSAGAGRSADIIADMDNTIGELEGGYREIQIAVDQVSEGLTGAASTAGSVADNVESVITGLDKIPVVIAELITFLGTVDRITRYGGR